MMKKTLSIKDIAIEAGVSITTVSFILNGKAKEKAISDVVTKKGYKIIYSSTENDVEKTKDLINMFKSRKVDADIVSPIKGIEEDIQILLNDDRDLTESTKEKRPTQHVIFPAKLILRKSLNP